jgi:cobalt-precorrin 5A hydrolase/precorrin-3B C17-methyltransferase
MSRVLVCSLTEAGAALARRLPYEHRHGDLVRTVAAEWSAVDDFVLVCAVGIAVRAIAPLLDHKATDPAVVCVDDGGRWSIALAGGHRGGANDLAREVAALLGAEPIVTTATDGAALPALDALPGMTAEGDVATVTRRWLDGTPPAVSVDPALRHWPVPAGLEPGTTGPPAVRVTDRAGPPGRGEVLLRPRSLVVGVGASAGADPEGLRELVHQALADGGLDRRCIELVVSIDAKAEEPAVLALAEHLAVPLRVFPADVLAGVDVPNPSAVVDAAVGTPSVAEAAALLTAGPAAILVVPKRRSADATVAIARMIPDGYRTAGGRAALGTHRQEGRDRLHGTMEEW